ncbi:MAG: M28 family peptidase [Planctomycetaceae bacterium]
MLSACFAYGFDERGNGTSVSRESVKSGSDEIAKEREQRLLESAKYLASDDLEGRGVGTKGLELAAKYIAEQYEQAGLKTALFEEKPYQVFRRRGKFKLGPGNHVRFVGSGQQIEPELGRDFVPLSWSQTGKLDSSLAFVGYGITAPEWNYDDYAGIDVTGRCVIILRSEPTWAGEKTSTQGSEKAKSGQGSDHAFLFRKIENAIAHGATGVIFCTERSQVHEQLQQRLADWKATMDRLIEAETAWRERQKTQPDALSEADLLQHQRQLKPLFDALVKTGDDDDSAVDPLLDLQVGSSNVSDRAIPVLHCKREMINRILQAAMSKSLVDVEAVIQTSQKPSSHLLSDWKIAGEVSVTWRGSELKNVAGLIEGKGEKAHETIVIGAHYDHLGRGGWGSLEMSSPNEIHNGADDNASGTSVLLEVSRLLAERAKKQPLSRRILCLAFTAEEQGLIGSEWYVKHPLFPLESTVAMLNLDMVGRLRKERLTVYGTDTATEFNALLNPLETEYGFRFTRKPDGYGPSDHSSFYGEQVPVLHFFTGFHPEYHRPADDYEKLNLEGMRRIAEMVADLAIEIAQTESRPTYNKTGAAWSLTSLLPSGNSTSKSSTSGKASEPRKAFLGVFCEAQAEEKGLKVKRVIAESPAESAGIRVGDLIQQVGDKSVASHAALAEVVSAYKSGDKLEMHIMRGALELDVTVTLEGR